MIHVNQRSLLRDIVIFGGAHRQSSLAQPCLRRCWSGKRIVASSSQGNGPQNRVSGWRANGISVSTGGLGPKAARRFYASLVVSPVAGSWVMSAMAALQTPQ